MIVLTDRLENKRIVDLCQAPLFNSSSQAPENELYICQHWVLAWDAKPIQSAEGYATRLVKMGCKRSTKHPKR